MTGGPFEQEQRRVSDERSRGHEGGSVHVSVHGSSGDACEAVADEITALVGERPEAVLGLATGSTMVGLYAALRARVDAGELSLSRVRTFNLDEYLGLGAASPQSFSAFMDRHLFGPCGIGADQVLFPAAPGAAEWDAGAFEDAIDAAGGIDLQLLGLGRNGHIAFNEPGSRRASRTRVVPLAEHTREDAAATFGGLEHVPTHAVTMGVGTILEARRIRVLAFGAHKAPAVGRILSGAPGEEVPGAFLSGHPDVRLHLDAEAASRIEGR